MRLWGFIDDPQVSLDISKLFILGMQHGLFIIVALPVTCPISIAIIE